MLAGDKTLSSKSDLSRVIAEKLFQRVMIPLGTLDLHDKQLDFINEQSKSLAFVAGIGSGKTFAGCVRATKMALGWVGNTRISTPNLGIVTAPTYSMLKDATFRTFEEVADAYIDKHNKSDMVTRLKNGSEIIWRSADEPMRLRGPNARWWYGDEAAFYTPDVRKIMIGRLRQFGERGYEFLTTTPKGKNWVWQRFVRDAKDSVLIKAKTAENRFLARDVVENWMSEYAGDFAAQELDGEFVAFEGLIYAQFNRERHVSTTRPETFERVVAGVDWGFANPGVIIVAGRDGDGRVWILHEEYQRQRRIEEWVQVASQVRDIWKVDQFFCDPSEPDYIRQFVEAGLKAGKADNQVLPGIQAVQNLMVIGGDNRVRFVVHPQAVNLLKEFENYQWSENRHGVQDAPVKANDHAMDALRYAIMGLNKTNKAEFVKSNPFFR